MTQTFLSRILAEKAKEVETMATEELQPLRDTYKLYDYLKSHPKQLQVIAEVKKPVPALAISILTWLLTSKQNAIKKTGQP